jgi:hypothetical protein
MLNWVNAWQESATQATEKDRAQGFLQLSLLTYLLQKWFGERAQDVVDQGDAEVSSVQHAAVLGADGKRFGTQVKEDALFDL